MADELRDWAPIEFTEAILAKHPAPRNSETGEKLWEQGIRLHGTQRAIMEDRYRFKQLRGGVRAGKSFMGGLAPYIDFLWMVVAAEKRGKRRPEEMLWWVAGPDYEQTQTEMNYIDRFLTEAGIPHQMTRPARDSWRIWFEHMPGVEFVSKTAKDPAKLAGKPPRGVVMAEAAQDVYGAWEAAQERVLQARGWVLLEGTFEGAAPWYYQMAEDWSKPGAVGVSYPLPTWANMTEFPLGRQDPAIQALERTWPPARFLERYGGEPTKPTNLVLPEASERWHVAHRYPHLKESYDPELPVHLAIDPGRSHAYAVYAFQCWGNVAWAIDAVYRWGRDAKGMVEEVASRPWARHVDMSVMDIAGEQASSTGESNANQWRELWAKKTGNGLYVHTQRVPLQLGYDLHARALLNSWPEEEAQRVFGGLVKGMRITDPDGPRLVFDPAAAGPLFGGRVDGRQYRGEYNLHRNPRRPDGTVPRDKPVDEDNDGIKAITYFLWWYFNASGSMRYLGPIGGGKEFMKWEVVVPA